jgi:hypothetical protein
MRYILTRWHIGAIITCIAIVLPLLTIAALPLFSSSCTPLAYPTYTVIASRVHDLDTADARVDLFLSRETRESQLRHVRVERDGETVPVEVGMPDRCRITIKGHKNLREGDIVIIEGTMRSVYGRRLQTAHPQISPEVFADQRWQTWPERMWFVIGSEPGVDSPLIP